ncbi:hypothetical protein EUX98_g8972 [Antrodiella citrinella]|uniref:Uncharacterized protein n=1 Tax=Antrodiella citrinella TaxID=2447956 RepID=A0A4S4M0E7_9APHY|nr:hypothetical protein EUX98_g8972 [Antrodiella citrinella]
MGDLCLPMREIAWRCQEAMKVYPVITSHAIYERRWCIALYLELARFRAHLGEFLLCASLLDTTPVVEFPDIIRSLNNRLRRDVEDDADEYPMSFDLAAVKKDSESFVNVVEQEPAFGISHRRCWWLWRVSDDLPSWWVEPFHRYHKLTIIPVTDLEEIDIGLQNMQETGRSMEHALHTLRFRLYDEAEAVTGNNPTERSAMTARDEQVTDEE